MKVRWGSGFPSWIYIFYIYITFTFYRKRWVGCEKSVSKLWNTARNNLALLSWSLMEGRSEKSHVDVRASSSKGRFKELRWTRNKKAICTIFIWKEWGLRFFKLIMVAKTLPKIFRVSFNFFSTITPATGDHWGWVTGLEGPFISSSYGSSCVSRQEKMRPSRKKRKKKVNSNIVFKNCRKLY